MSLSQEDKEENNSKSEESAENKTLNNQRSLVEPVSTELGSKNI